MSKITGLHPNGKFEGDEQAYDWVQELPAHEPKIEPSRTIDENFERHVNVLQNNLTQVTYIPLKNVQTYLKSSVSRHDRIEITNRNDVPVFIICEVSKSNICNNGYTVWTGSPEKAGLTPVENDEDEGYF